ncbi:MAG: hypothetical protein AVDCRST_MAG93-278 [uncultured Chloroflexia bacterium]|uniref:Uncharacterized protein n=1 Tax=uncultured Chloroflexia bacterium TaxID=1672391 RepID=A0A6J4H9L5_9CHLR|nr:MAG: hypothetical protein AVDCRST_MAG93-278 [uncultured Chloroflexia bacterium]
MRGSFFGGIMIGAKMAILIVKREHKDGMLPWRCTAEYHRNRML